MLELHTPPPPPPPTFLPGTNHPAPLLVNMLLSTLIHALYTVVMSSPSAVLLLFLLPSTHGIVKQRKLTTEQRQA